MKFLNICFILLLNISLYGQENVNERVYIHLDKDCYIAGEDIWIKFCVIDQNLEPSLLSKVGYVEICDTQKPYIQTMYSLEAGMGVGKIKIPSGTPTGIYQLYGYTRYMRNDENSFFKRQISIINMNQEPNSERIELVNNEQIQSEEIPFTSNIAINTDKSKYVTRSHVNVSVNNLPENIVDLVVTVIRQDAITILSPPKIDKWLNEVHSRPSTTNWLPEYEGHIITGKITTASEQEIDLLKITDITASIGFVGKEIRLMEGQMDSKDNTVLFYTDGIYGEQEVVTSVVTNENHSLRMDIQSPFSGLLPTTLPLIQLSPENKNLIDRYIGVQLQQIMFIDSLGNQGPIDNIYHLKPTLSYDLDQYNRFNTLEETITEFIRKIIVSRIDGKRRIRVLDEERKYNVGNTLVLLDGVPLYDHEYILQYNPHLIKRINIYDGRYKFGGNPFECMVSVITKQENLPSIQLPEYSQLFVYNCPMLPVEFESPDYSTDNTYNSLLPDFRHTLYWNPFINGIPNKTIPLSFYTSDMTGEYKIVVKGFTKEGNSIYGESVFIVE